MTRLAAAIALGLLVAGRAQAQCAPVTLPVSDTGSARVLAPVVVTTPERVTRSLMSSVAAVTRLEASELARLPRTTLADVLKRAPGFVLVDFDGLGFDPQVMVRGFYGGGEAEYVVMLVDGKPVNQLQSGTVAWDVLPPLATIEAVEVVRGSASSHYGDAAVAGVINVLTRRPGDSLTRAQLRLDAAGGSEGTWRAAAELQAPDAWKRVTLSAAMDRTGGWREHSERFSLRVGGRVPLLERSQDRLAATVRGHWRDFEEPGPLFEDLYRQDPSQAGDEFLDDRTRDKGVSVGLEGSRRLSGAAATRLTARLGAEIRDVNAIRTIVLAPGAGDTKERMLDVNRQNLGFTIETNDLPLPGPDRLMVGIEASRGMLDSRYYFMTLGERGPVDTDAESTRLAGAIFAEYAVRPVDPVRFVVGARLDGLRDRFSPRTGAAVKHSGSHSALSPRVGANLRFLASGTAAGNLYLSVGRSFKAPTLDQLYDQRTIPVPFGPGAITTSNPELKPQHGTSLEAGVYQSLAVSSGLLFSGSLSAYQISMTDELDFDVQSFRYVNIGKSRHRGLEAELTITGNRVSGFAGYTLQHATARSGDNLGKRLKAIPRHALHAGVTALPLPRLDAGLSLTRAAGVYLDDANTVALPDFTRLDAQAGFRVSSFTLRVEVRNLLDKHYASSGFLFPSSSGRPYFYPAAGRVVEIGLGTGW